ncbi:MAG: NUDIX domain-containing protein [Gammaproteobacteria bacterium]|nr:NUDIX domain-containing protein [Gammaproteobacteria bacterium]
MSQKRPAKPTNEAEFLDAYDPGAFERPSVAVDVVLLTVREDALEVALLRRAEHPDKGQKALPGAFVGIAESLDDAAARLVAEKVGRSGIYLEQLYTFGAPQRDPRMRIITVAYCALVNPERLADLDAGLERCRIHVPWGGETGGAVEVRDDYGAPLTLALDHAEVVGVAVKRIRGKLNYAPIGYQLLPEEFTLRRLQQVHETILDNPVNKDSFRRRMLATGDLEATGRLEQEVGHRPAELYRFSRRSAV